MIICSEEGKGKVMFEKGRTVDSAFEDLRGQNR